MTLLQLCFGIAAPLIFLLCDERFEEHDGGRPSLWTLDTVESIHQLFRCVIPVCAERQQPGRAISCLDRYFERARDGSQRGRLRIALSVQKLVDDCPV